jgi:PKD repeat protein
LPGVIETPADTNGNSLYDTLTVSNDITIDRAGLYVTAAVLSGDRGSGQEVVSIQRNQSTFAAGNYSIASVFPGTDISSAGIDGPYTVTLTWRHDYQENGDPPSISWQTGAYTSTEFEPASAGFAGTATASPAGRNLSAITPLIINKAGEYTIEGYLQDPDGQIIAHAAETRTFSTGAINANLIFDGNTIAAHHHDGTYRLVNFRILDASDTTVSRLVNAGTVTIDSSDFGTMVALLTDSFSAAGLFPNSDGKFESLLVTAGITAPYEGRYFYSASLFDAEGGHVETIHGATIELPPGAATLSLRFSGAKIYTNRVNGTFSVRSLEIFGPTGSDSRSHPLTTGSFLYTDFTSPPVIIMGNVTDYPVDYDSDGIYDAIRIGFDVETGTFSSGTATIPLLGELTVSGANQSGVANTVIAKSLVNNPQLAQQKTHHVTLDFAGTDINGMGISGPYDLTLLQAGKKSSAITPYYYPESYATTAYDYTQFGPATILMGTVSNEFSQPLEGVEISAAGKSTRTNPAGFYRMYYATGGSTGVLAMPPDGSNITHDYKVVNLVYGSTTYRNFTLFSPVVLYGTVTAENGTVLTEGSISITGTSTRIFQLNSWGNGSYQISGIKNGTYDLSYTRVGSSDVMVAPMKDTVLHPGEKREWIVTAYNPRSLSGTVTDIYGDPLEEAAVSITDGPITKTWPFNVETDGAGIYTYPKLVPGSYTVEAEPPSALRNDLIANSSSMTIEVTDSTVTHDIILIPEPAEPVAGDFISCNTTGGPPPLTVSFEDRASGYPTAWLWDFGDGETSTERHPVHTYTDYGVYNITLTVSNDYGTDTGYFEEWIWVEEAPVPEVQFATGTLSSGASGLFAVAVTDITRMDMADGVVLTLSYDPAIVQLNEVTWHAPFSGQPITANIDNGAGEAEIMLSFWSSPDLSEMTELADLNFTAVGSSGAESLLTADPAVWRSCPDGCVNHPLSVTNGTIRINIGGSALPVPDFTANPTSGSSPLSVAFDSSLSDVVAPTAYLWTFGDGETSVLADPVHSYEVVGTHDVALRITNSSGSNTITMTGYITVTSPPSPVLPIPVVSANATSGTVPLAIQFSSAASVVTSPTAYLWTFGDGETSVLSNPSHSYITAGTYDVALSITNSSGTNTTTRTGYITASPASQGALPRPAFTADTTSGAVPLTVQFSSATSDALTPTGYLWTFGDSSTSVLENPSHVYTAVGVYGVSLRITNSSGFNTTTRARYISTHSMVGTNASLPSNSTITGDQISVNLTGAGDTEVNGDQIILNNQGGFDQIIFFTSGVTNTTGNLTGTVTGVQLTTPLMTAAIPEGAVTFQANISASSYNSGGSINFTFVGADENLNSAYQSLLGSQLNETALVFEITATGMDSVTGSVLTFTVPDAFRERNSGGIAVIWTHAGTSTVLTATYLGSSGGISTYYITVPGGFSTFGVVGLGTVNSPPAPSSPSSPSSVDSGSLTSSSDSSPFSQAVPVTGTQTVNVGGSSAIRQVTVTGTGIHDLVVSAYSRWSPTPGIPELTVPVYQYVEINPARYTTITSATIQFSVPQQWVDEKQITADTIELYHYTAGQWKALPTHGEKTENGRMYFTAESSGFSLFAIAVRSAGDAFTVPESRSPQTFGDLAQTPTTGPVKISSANTGQFPTATETVPVQTQPDTVPGYMVPVLIAGAVAAILIGSVVLVRRWWIRRQNPALFRDYD